MQVIFISNTQKWHLDRAIVLCGDPEVLGPCNEISKIPPGCFFALRCQVCVQNLSSLASKLRQTDRWTDRQTTTPTPIRA